MARRVLCLMSFVLMAGAAGNVSAEELGAYYVIEDFESYNSDAEMKVKWKPEGATEIYYRLNLEYPYSGLKCLYINYWTYESPYYCGVSRIETPWIPADWTFEGTAETLSLWFFGYPNLADNGIVELYVRLKDSSDIEATVQYSDNWPVSNFDNQVHQEWNIGLQEFVDNNSAIDLTNVKMLEIGVLDGLGNPPALMGEGFIYFDDIRLYPRRCILKYGQPGADLNDDCVVDGVDLSIMAGDWLDYDYSLTVVAVDPCDANLVAHWKLDESDPCTVAIDSSGNGHHGTVNTVGGNPMWDPNGKVDGAIELMETITGDYIDCGGGKDEGEPNTWADITGEITVMAWIKPKFDFAGFNRSSIVNKGLEAAWELHNSRGYGEDLSSVSFYVDVPEVPWYGVRGQTDIFDLKWHHVAGVYKIHQAGVSSEVIVYTDGAKEGRLLCSGSVIGTCDKDVIIGYTTLLTVAHGWYGHIDDVRVYDRALDHSEIVGIVKAATVGPLASYEFDTETGGITPDSSGGHDGTLVNGASIVYDVDRDSNVLELDGVDAYVELADSGHDLNEPNCTDEPANCTWADITGEFTFAAWVKPDINEAGNYRAVVFGKGDDGGYHRDYPSEPNRPREGWSMLRLNSDNVVTVAVTSTPWNLTPVEGIEPEIDVNIWDGKWHHIAATHHYLHYRVDLYIDGINATEYWGLDIKYPSTTNYPIWIGANVGEVLGGGAYSDGYHGWKGRIDDVRIYNRALTEFEIGSVMGGGDLYVPLTSLANLYNEELVNNKIINFRDYQILAHGWLEDETFPFSD